jgi:hypothetical protein
LESESGQPGGANFGGQDSGQKDLNGFDLPVLDLDLKTE